MRCLSAFVVALVLCPVALSSQQVPTQIAEPDTVPQGVPWHPSSPGVEAEFEVATVKPSDPDQCCARYFSRNGRRFATTNTTLKYLIQWAWNLQAKQVGGGPAWMDVDRFNLAGEMDGTGTPNDHEWKVAVQRLLTDRFHLQMHHDQREMSAFALTVASKGSKLMPGDGKVDAHQSMGFSGAVGETMYGRGTNASIADFIGELQRIVLDRPIVDRTGLTGVYDIQLQFTREDPNALGMAQLPDSAAPNLFSALEQQLGLRLQGEKAAVDVLVIDHAEPPSAN
jgi:uncharacterized protein (TIGR03435 family)